ncbi:uncharacterized protein LOC121930010 [Sceloporus undulatus]|uniref:uncharacterized protein LOC121930010 n=1 Tax=Sceloporus undulatus TaxID=8520 RepID=UPI001C4D2487|nr:uncharacterized protein LOC121930010 [Sceloporus undulatus]XP_042322079.1 uncharacterized protein LOC121930010 [Sceloporus undulatus]XP_042322080.1 uncharacterized protein LOC121930010 [Sceloporus undulatus]XP_042322081.1 uncharacterized protein LOC121930010 [Sceloporus undulatus]
MSFQSNASTLSLKDIMENGFLISSSSYNFSPGSSCLLEMNSIPRTEAWNKIQNMSKDSSLSLKVTETSLNGMKNDLQASGDGAALFCKTPIQPYTFDLSNLSSANNSKANSTVDVFCETKSSTPCKDDKVSKLTENMLLKSSEMNDSATFKKPPAPPMWEISGIQATLDNTLSLETSIEELVSLGSMKTETPSLEMSHFAMPLAGSGVPVPVHQAPAL